MKVNGEAVYGTSASPFPYEMPWGRITQRPGRLYLHLFDWPRGELVIRGLHSRVRKAYLLCDPERRLAAAQRREPALDTSVLALSGFGRRPDRRVSVVVLEIDGKARVDGTPLQQPDGSITLPAFAAERKGPAGRLPGERTVLR